MRAATMAETRARPRLTATNLVVGRATLSMAVLLAQDSLDRD